MGGLIPGILFNFSLIVCFILPIIVFKLLKPDHQIIAKDAFDNHILVLGNGSTPAIGGWFWFAVFLTFLFLSYVAGHVFFRSDINRADKADIEVRMKRNTKEIMNKLIAKKNDIDNAVSDMLNLELDQLKVDIDKIPGIFDNDPDTKDLKLLLQHIINNIDNIKNPPESKGTDNCQSKQKQDQIDEKRLLTIWSVLSPHKYDETNTKEPNPWSVPDSKTKSDYLSLDEKRIFDYFYREAKYIIGYATSNRFIRFVHKLCKSIVSNKYLRNLWKQPSYDNYSTTPSLLASYLILLLQNDSGCSHFEKRFEKQSDFPYINFYKYLLKRNELNLIQYVDWSPAGARTKNKINRMKIDIQLDYPDAYAILNKNESHIRMASSSWYVARFVKRMAIICAFLIFIPLFIRDIYANDAINLDTINNAKQLIKSIINPLMGSTLAALPPILLAFLMHRLRNQITKFIHYQRLREIYFTLYIYHKLAEKKQEKQGERLE